MQVRALSTFNSKRYGLIRTGLVLTVDKPYGDQLIRLSLVEAFVPPDLQAGQGERAPPRNMAIPKPPKTKDPPENPPKADPSSPRKPADGSAISTSVPRRGGGRGRRSASRPADPA